MYLVMRRTRLAMLAVLLVSCSSQMQPAEQERDAAQKAVEVAAPDAAAYMPERLKTLQDRLATLKSSFDQKDYASVLASGPGLVSDAASLQQQAATKKVEAETALSSQWTHLNAAVPGMFDAVKARIDELSKHKRTPKGIDLGEAHTALTQAEALWDQATASHTAGNMEPAIASAKNAQAKVQAAADALQLKLPTASS